MIKYIHEPFGRDIHFTIPTFDFFFKVILPKANKGRIILERDRFGRILHSGSVNS